MNRKIKERIQKHMGLFFALASAFLYAFNVIIEKNYIKAISSEQILFFMYLGAGVGLFCIYFYQKKKKKYSSKKKITKKEVPKIAMICTCELIASFLLIESLKVLDASLVSLLSVSEIVMTSLCTYLLFKGKITKNEMIAIVLIVVASIISNFKDGMIDKINLYSLFVVGTCFFWGLENNITAQISSKEPALFTSIKCGVVSIMYLIILLFKGNIEINFPILILFGFFTYGLSILSYALSTKYLGASKATLVFSLSPILSVILSILIYKESITLTFLISLFLMIIGILYINNDGEIAQKEENEE